MCGIHGIISWSLKEQEIQKRLKAMGKMQRHRGPDDQREDVFHIADRGGDNIKYAVYIHISGVIRMQGQRHS